jgi:hypothetical protein
MHLGQHGAAVNIRGAQQVPAQQQLMVHMVSAHGLFKTRHPLAPVKLILWSVQLVLVTEKSNHVAFVPKFAAQKIYVLTLSPN